MNKETRSKFYFIILIVLLLLLSILGYFIGLRNDIFTSEQTHKTVEKKIFELKGLDGLKCEPFLKNTIYLFDPSDDYGMLSIDVIDSSYTPPIITKIKYVTLEIDLDKKIAIAFHSQYVKHKILQIDYGIDYAEITTDKGKIFVYKPNKYFKNEYQIVFIYEKLKIVCYPVLR